MLNWDIPATSYEYIFSDNMKLIYNVYRWFDDNMYNREILIQNKENQLRYPLYAV